MPEINLFNGDGIEERMDEIDAKMMREDERVVNNERAILVELVRAKKLHPVWPESVVDQIAIMMGEAGEALKAALHYREGRQTEGVDSLVMLRRELIQTGAMVQRCLLSIDKLS